MTDYDRRKKVSTSVPTRHNWDKLAQHMGVEVPWWEGTKFSPAGSMFRTDPESLMGYGLLKKALEGGPTACGSCWSGNLVVPASQLLQTCQKVLHLRPIWREGGTKNGTHLFASADTMVQVYLHSRGAKAHVSAVTSSPKMAHHTGQLFDRCLQPDDPEKGMVFTLAKTMNGYRISHLGVAGSPIERDNYSPEVLKAYDHIVEDLNTESPCGRLIVLAGEPGTGKTYLVRSLLGAVPKAAFVLVPPHLVEELGSPEILPSLTAAKGEMAGPIVMVIEDADACLVPRKDAGNKQGNMNAISSLLNLGDGILGSVLDIRIIATTNAQKLEMDPATQRPGRMCTYASVDALPAECATKALNRLTGQKRAFKKQATLAEVYLYARKLGWKPPTKTASAEQRPLRTEIL